LRMILWGVFKKVVIADSCAEYVDHVYANPELFSGSSLLFVAVLFSFQIYGDFSGYSDIATGVSKLFGIDLLRNFKTPYFARSITEFWKRWHISLSSWFRDYLFKPIGGSKVNNFITARNLLVVFLVSGLWHGANITFIIWGALHATFVIAERFINHGKLTNSITPDSEQLNLSDVIRMAWVFGVVTILWIFFRAAHITDALSFLAGMCNWSLFSLPSSADFSTMTVHPAILLLLIAAFTAVEWQDRNRPYTLAFLDGLRYRASRFAVYYVILSLVFVVPSKPENFIYFQF
jgi:alginate O-acetyltransferase complex protein AlgI